MMMHSDHQPGCLTRLGCAGGRTASGYGSDSSLLVNSAPRVPTCVKWNHCGSACRWEGNNDVWGQFYNLMQESQVRVRPEAVLQRVCVLPTSRVLRPGGRLGQGS